MRAAALAILLCWPAAAWAQAPAAPAAAPETRTFRDWTVTCRPDRYCVAETPDRSTAMRSPPANVLRVARHATQPNWEISVRVNARRPDLRADPMLWVDEDGETLELGTDVRAYGSASEAYVVGEAAQRAMERFGPGRTVRFEFTDTESMGHAAVFSLSGLTASLLWIDERQRRVGAPRAAGRPPAGLRPVAD